MHYLLILMVFVAFIGCGEEAGKVYSETEAIEKSFELECALMQKCDAAAFNAQYGSLAACITESQEINDTRAGDDAYTYSPLCGEAETYRPGAMAAYIACMEKLPCAEWSGDDYCYDQQRALCVEQSGSCTEDNECPDGQKCDTDSGQCVYEQECYTQFDCAEGFICDEGVCVPSIEVGGACAGEGQQVCSSIGEQLLVCTQEKLALVEDCATSGKECVNTVCVTP